MILYQVKRIKLSLIIDMINLYFFLLYEDLQMFYLNDETDWRSNPVEGVEYPIWLARNRFGISRGPVAINDFLNRIYNFSE
jgi:hypothetical protein